MFISSTIIVSISLVNIFLKEIFEEYKKFIYGILLSGLITSVFISILKSEQNINFAFGEFAKVIPILILIPLCVIAINQAHSTYIEWRTKSHQLTLIQSLELELLNEAKKESEIKIGELNKMEEEFNRVKNKAIKSNDSKIELNDKIIRLITRKYYIRNPFKNKEDVINNFKKLENMIEGDEEWFFTPKVNISLSNLYKIKELHFSAYDYMIYMYINAKVEEYIWNTKTKLKNTSTKNLAEHYINLLKYQNNYLFDFVNVLIYRKNASIEGYKNIPLSIFNTPLIPTLWIQLLLLWINKKLKLDTIGFDRFIKIQKEKYKSNLELIKELEKLIEEENGKRQMKF